MSYLSDLRAWAEIRAEHTRPAIEDAPPKEDHLVRQCVIICLAVLVVGIVLARVVVGLDAAWERDERRRYAVDRMECRERWGYAGPGYRICMNERGHAK